MTIYPRGSEWRKWDLHVHSPSSYDYKNKSVTNDEIIEILKRNDISVVVFTDHHIIDVERIWNLYQLGLKNNITVLAGIEFLSDSRGEEPIHFIGIFDIKDKERLTYIWEQLKNRTNISKIYGKDHKVEEVYCDLEETTNLIHELGGLITIHAGTKSSSIECITNALPHTMAQKKDIVSLVDIFELGKKEDEKGYIEKVFPNIGHKPMILCSDNHNIKEYNLKTNCWIKADPTFEGLKQIIYEPGDRVKIQEEEPEQKDPYNLIDYVQFIDSKETFTNEKIYLNQNLNVIIGGKSTGKSILLREIARTINPNEVKNRLEEANLKDYKIYEDGKALTDNFTVKWIDEKEDRRNNERDNYRKIIYIPQSYLNRLVEKDEEQSPIDRLIENILKNDENIKHFFESVDSQINENNRYISNEINELIQNLQQLNTKVEEIKNLGDKAGIEKYIKDIENEIKVFHKKGGLTEEEISQFSIIKENIEKLNNEINNFSKQKEDYKELLSTKKFEKTYKFNQITEKYEQLNIYANTLISRIENEFNKYLQEEIKEIDNFIIKKNSELNNLKKQIEPLLEKVKNIEILKNKNELLSKQEEKLKQIKEKEAEKEKLEEKRKESINKLVDYFIKFYEIKSEFTKKIEQNNSLNHDLELEIKVNPKNEKFNEEFINEVFDIRSLRDNLKDFNLNIENIDNLKLKIRDLIINIFNNSIRLKKQYNDNIKEVIQKLIKDWFIINYSVTYDGDKISDMSQGKKSFVLLRLIIELDNSKCPLLIDQPEDDLDNRSIYNEIVKFLKEKKKERQIIIVTHNANLAVATDAECIIVANQNGEKTKNKKFKFEYVQGSLENTFIKDEINEILYKQGIKEHVCDILEGGEQAFEKRKNKYNFK